MPSPWQDRAPSADEAESSPSTNALAWFLTGRVSDDEPVRTVPIHVSPFRVGRQGNVELQFSSQTISRLHAEIFDQGDILLVRDLASTNGTFVNGRRVRGTAALHPDDLIQFSDFAFRVSVYAAIPPGIKQTVTEDVGEQVAMLMHFDNLMSNRAVVPNYQPIVTIADGRTVAYEVLGRSRLPGLEMPADMFRAASHLDLEAELSRLLRHEGVIETKVLASPPHLFVNTHPCELVKPGLLESLRAIREASPRQPLTLELHEAAVTDVRSMCDLRAALRELNVSLAYDDFGQGQSRLIELVEIRPDYIKFDITMIRDIHHAPRTRQGMLEKLVQLVNELGLVSLAEGIECREEAEVCQHLGFQLAQGFYYGRPNPIQCLDEFQTRNLNPFVTREECQ